MFLKEETEETIDKYKKDSEELHKQMPPVYCALMGFGKELRRMTNNPRKEYKEVISELHKIVFDGLALCFIAANTFDMHKKLSSLFELSGNIDALYTGLHYMREHEQISIGQYGILTKRLSKTEKQVINWLNTERRQIGSQSKENRTSNNELT